MNLVTPAQIERYTNRDCAMLAVAMHRLTGLPIVLVSDDVPDGEWTHALVRTDADHALDVEGIHTEFDLINGHYGDYVVEYVADRGEVCEDVILREITEDDLIYMIGMHAEPDDETLDVALYLAARYVPGLVLA